MTALVSQNSEQEQNHLKKPSQMVNIKFKYRKLGVNAQANNYAFADDCYSQWTVSPKYHATGKIPLLSRQPSSFERNKEGGEAAAATLSISQGKLQFRRSGKGNGRISKWQIGKRPMSSTMVGGGGSGQAFNSRRHRVQRRK